MVNRDAGLLFNTKSNSNILTNLLYPTQLSIKFIDYFVQVLNELILTLIHF